MKPKLFIGSSIEGLDIAYALQENLEYTAEVTVWDQDVFKLSASSLESLLSFLAKTDYGVFVFTPDDVTQIRGKSVQTVRDNVIFELGLFVGRLGKDNCFMVVPTSSDEFHMPTDLLGITPGTFNAEREDRNLNAALGPVCNKIRKQLDSPGKSTEIAHSEPISKPENDIEEKILLTVSKTGDSGVGVGFSQVAREFPELSKTKLEYYLNELLEKEMLYSPLVMSVMGNNPESEYFLQQDGRKYLVERDLV